MGGAGLRRSMIRRERSGWNDPLGAALLLMSIVILAVLLHTATPAPGLVIEHWHAAPATH